MNYVGSNYFRVKKLDRPFPMIAESNFERYINREIIYTSFSRCCARQSNVRGNETLPSFAPLTPGGLPQEIDHLLRAQLFTFRIVKRWNLENSNPNPGWPIVVALHSECENRPERFFYDPPHERSRSASKTEPLHYLRRWGMTIFQEKEKDDRRGITWQ